VVSPQLTLQIGVDPITWYLHEADFEALSAQLSQGAGPVAVPVFGPLTGRLVLSPRSAGSIFLGPPGAGHGTHPSDVRYPGAPSLLYVPNAIAPSTSAPGYWLSPDADLASLEQDIMTAMIEGTVLSVPVNIVGGPAVIVLSGASLSYAVLCPPKRPGPPGS